MVGREKDRESVWSREDWKGDALARVEDPNRIRVSARRLEWRSDIHTHAGKIITLAHFFGGM